MKLLSVCIPCYNSEAYMEGCVESVLAGGEDVEIIIVDDGSKDNTGEIADRLAATYPTIVKAVHQENGGHGEAVNSGIKNATGLYYKVVDSDDRVDRQAFLNVLNKLKEYVDEPLDLMLANYVYVKEGASNHAVQYTHCLPQGHVFDWDEVGHFKYGQYILMHSTIYRTSLLRDSGLVLPKHTFYVDNLYVFEPLMHVHRMYYMNENVYLYTIGREDQSVNEQIMISRIDQQMRVNREMYEFFSKNKNEIAKSKRLYAYMFEYLEIIDTVSSVLMIITRKHENLKKRDELWKFFKETDPALYKKLRRRLLGWTMNLHTYVGNCIPVWGYKIAQKIVKFN